MRKPVLTRRELVSLLEHNGFEMRGRTGSSHTRYVGVVDGRTCNVTVDDAVAGYTPASHSILYYIVSTQLGFYRGGSSANDAWKRFYAGEPSIARRAQVPYERWG